MDHRHQQERPADPVQQGQVVVLDGAVYALLEQERNADVGGGVERYRQNGEDCIALVGGDVGHQAHNDLVVVSGADD